MTLAAAGGCSSEDTKTATAALLSPDKNLEMKFSMSDNGTPYYSLDYKGKHIVLDSRLGFLLRGDLNVSEVKVQGDKIDKVDKHPLIDFYRDFEVADVKTDSLDYTWAPVWGEEDSIRCHYNELTVSLKHKPTGRDMAIRFRLFNDGLGFRYEFGPMAWPEYFIINDELTEFAMAEDYTAFWIPGDFDTQEYEYTRSRISEIPSLVADQLLPNPWHFPYSVNAVQTSLQMKSDDGVYVNLHEAALVDYSCMNLELEPGTLTFKASLVPDATGGKGTIQTPAKSPWRTIQVTDDACRQLESRLVLNLNEPCALDDVSWIHPVKYIGVWWEMISGKGSWSYTGDVRPVDINTVDYSKLPHSPKHSANTENVRRYIDFAAEHGFSEVLVEGWNIGWEDWESFSKNDVFDFVTPYPDFDIAGLNEYAHSKGVRLMMHHETSSSIRNYERHMDAAYDLMNKYGYDAVKSGYVGQIFPRGEHHYGQYMNNHYQYAIRKAAEHHIMVNAHEAVRPTGLCRTYPNMIGNESAKGTEYQAFGGLHPQHVTILPFTRLNGGPMDYTPGVFVMDMKENCPTNKSHVNATICNQLALYLTMYSPLQMAADFPEHYMKYADAFQFIKDVAVDWRKSKYLFAEPGDYLIVARQAKDSGQWFVGGVTDELSRSFEVPMSFLDAGENYEVTLYADSGDADYKTNPQSYVISKVNVTSESVVPVTMAPGGGFAMSVRKM
ncbi:MAG: glycoside hydrolase family 97 protein [Bacteroidales bacterium]|nr:glycoside hydrolase family 97 protein [Bacteroidales bacterium]MBD9294336.1 glycoside hydrolase family 97 protein [Bacteroidales bacterium]